MEFAYRFPVVKGIQANNEYYIAMVPLKMLARLFPDTEEYVAPEYRAQRKLNTSRIPVMCKYVTDNRNNYVFSAHNALLIPIINRYKTKYIPICLLLQERKKFLLNLYEGIEKRNY